MTPDDRKTKEQLIAELDQVRRRLSALEAHADSAVSPEFPQRDGAIGKNIADELRLSAARESLILHTLPMVFYMTRRIGEYDTAWVSEQVRDISGFEPDAFLAGLWQHRIHPEDRARVLANLAVIADRGAVHNEYRWLTANGEYRWFADNAALVRNADGQPEYIVGTWHDITDRKRSEEALLLTQFCMERASLGTYWIGPDARILRVNQHACKALGYSREELCSMHVGDIDPNFPRDRWPEHWNHLRSCGSMHFETVHRRKDGTMYPVEINNNYFQYGNQEFDFSFALDISERKQAEGEKALLEEQVQRAQKLESLGILAGGIAHDFNNLLMVVLGNANLALQDLSEVSPARPMIEEVERTARRAAELCNQMLAYSGRGVFVVKPINLTELVEEMTYMLEVSVSKKVVMRYNLAPNLPSVEADPTQIRQILMNLVINGSEAIAEKSGVISVTTGVMECDRQYLNGAHVDEGPTEGFYVYIEVSDTGCGMDEETRRKIFDPFFTTKFVGRGLGLAAVLGIVRSHKGAIKIYSELGRGTTFKVLLPALDTPAESLRPRASSGSEWRGSGVVLVVDDEETVRALGKRMLKRMGFEVLVAKDGRDALRVFQERGDEIRCVLLDLTMPHMDGEETYRELRRISPGVRVIMTSGYNEQEVVNRFAGKGLAGFIQKPYTMPELSATLKAILDHE